MTAQETPLLRGFLDALIEDVEDEATWAALANWAQENGEGLRALAHHNGPWRWEDCLSDKEGVRTFTRAGTLVDLFSLLAPTKAGRDRCSEVQLYDGWAESEFATASYVAVGNWNATGVYAREEDPNARDRSPEELGDLLTKIGFECEWSDQVSTCDDCHKLIRTEPDNWHWQPQFSIGDGYIVCHACRPPTPHEDTLQEDELRDN